MASRGLSMAVSALWLTILGVEGARAGDLVLEISGVRGASGELRIALYDSADTFLKEGAMAAGVRLKLSLMDSPESVVISLHGLQPGDYAVSTYHDADGDGRMGTSLLGLPTEGHGFSGETAARFGPPDFTTAAFHVGGTVVRVPIELAY